MTIDEQLRSPADCQIAAVALRCGACGYGQYGGVCAVSESWIDFSLSATGNV